MFGATESSRSRTRSSPSVVRNVLSWISIGDSVTSDGWFTPLNITRDNETLSRAKHVPIRVHGQRRGLDRFALLFLPRQACQPQLVMHPHQRVTFAACSSGRTSSVRRDQSAGCRRSSSHAYACHAARLVVVRVVRVLRFPAESNSSVTVVSGCPPRPMRAISLSHWTWASASAFFRAAENTEYSEGLWPRDWAAIVLELASRGADVVLCYLRRHEAAEETVREASSLGVRAEAV